MVHKTLYLYGCLLRYLYLRVFRDEISLKNEEKGMGEKDSLPSFLSDFTHHYSFN